MGRREGDLFRVYLRTSSERIVEAKGERRRGGGGVEVDLGEVDDGGRIVGGHRRGKRERERV